MTNELTQNVTRILSAALGDFVARAMLDRNCETIGTTPQALSAEQLPHLADTIERSISFFADKETGKQVAQKLRALGNSQHSPSGK